MTSLKSFVSGLILIAGIFVWASVAEAADTIFFDNAGSQSSAKGDVPVLVMPFNVGDYADRLLFVGAMNAGGPDDRIASVTYAGVTMYRLKTSLPTGRFLALYVLEGPQVGTHDIEVVCNPHCYQIDITAWSYYGTKQSHAVKDYALAQSIGSGTSWVLGVTTTVPYSFITAINRFDSATEPGWGTIERLVQINYAGVFESEYNPFVEPQYYAVEVTGSSVANGGIVIGFAPAVAGGITGSIVFDFPLASSSVRDFGSWLFHKTFTGTSTGQIHIGYENYSYGGEQAYSDVDYNVPAGGQYYYPVLKTHALSLGNWNVGAQLYVGTSLIDQAIINFSVVSTSTPISAETASTTCSMSGWNLVAWAECQLWLALLVPDQSRWDRLTNFTTSTQNGITLYYKPPFGYLRLASTTMGGLGVGSTTSTLLASLAGSPYRTYLFDPLWAGITAVLWIFFMFWVFHRARKIEL